MTDHHLRAAAQLARHLAGEEEAASKFMRDAKIPLGVVALDTSEPRREKLISDFIFGVTLLRDADAGPIADLARLPPENSDIVTRQPGAWIVRWPDGPGEGFVHFAEPATPFGGV